MKPTQAQAPADPAARDDRSHPRWTLERVEARLVEAVDTLKRLPAPRIQARTTRWPDFVRDSREAYGWTTARLRLAPASPDAIGRLDETLDWLRWLPRPAQRIVWARASGLSWRRIAQAIGKSPNTCRAWYLSALHHIAARLDEGASDGPQR